MSLALPEHPGGFCPGRTQLAWAVLVCKHFLTGKAALAQRELADGTAEYGSKLHMRGRFSLGKRMNPAPWASLLHPAPPTQLPSHQGSLRGKVCWVRGQCWQQCQGWLAQGGNSHLPYPKVFPTALHPLVREGSVQAGYCILAPHPSPAEPALFLTHRTVGKGTPQAAAIACRVVLAPHKAGSLLPSQLCGSNQSPNTNPKPSLPAARSMFMLKALPAPSKQMWAVANGTRRRNRQMIGSYRRAPCVSL